MDRLRAKELLPIIEAFANGEEIEFKHIGQELWTIVNDGCSFDIYRFVYRIKPKAREFWLCWHNADDGVEGKCHRFEIGHYSDDIYIVNHWDNYIKVREVL